MTKLAFVTIGDTRTMPAPPRGALGSLSPTVTRTEVYARYASALVGQANVLRASTVAQARSALDGWPGRSAGASHIYLIGHGNTIGFAFGVSIVGGEATSDPDRWLRSPMTRSRAGVSFPGSASYDVVARFASIMEAHRGRSYLQVRACYLSDETLLGYAGTIRRAVPPSNVELSGYTDFYALIERSNGTFRSEIQRASRFRRDAFETVSVGNGLAAPHPQLAYCVRGGDVLEGRCR